MVSMIADLSTEGARPAMMAYSQIKPTAMINLAMLPAGQRFKKLSIKFMMTYINATCIPETDNAWMVPVLLYAISVSSLKSAR